MSDTTQSKRNIYQRILEVQKKVQTVLKNEHVKMFDNDKGYKAVTHDDVAAALHLPLAEAGIVLLPTVVGYTASEFEVEKNGPKGKYIQKWYRTDIEIKVEWVNADNPDDRISSTGHAFALDTSDKSYAKAYSLALKVVLLKFHLLESRDQEEQRSLEKDLAEGKLKQNKQSDQRPQNIYQKFTGNPKDYVSKLTKGKKLGELDHAQLAKIREWTTGQLKGKPRPKNIAEIADLHDNVKKVQTEIPPADLPPPDFDPQSFPMDDQPLPPEAYYDNPFDEFEDTKVKPIAETPNFAPGGSTAQKDDGPGSYVLPKLEYPRGFTNLWGKRLDSLQPATLDAYLKSIQAESVKTPKPPNVAEMFGVIGKIKAYLETF